MSAEKTFSAANAANRIAQVGQTSFGHDDEGQIVTSTTSQGTTSYEWDARGRMTRAVLPNGQQVSYSYDALGRRASRTAGGTTTSFLYDGADVVLDSASGGSLTDYLNGTGIDEKLRQSDSGGAKYFLQDHLGSTVALTDATGGVLERQQYEAFGASGGSSLTRYGYTGRELDSSTGLIYYRARWYDPQQERFITEDPIGMAGGLNLYEYVGSNPVSYDDPLGLQDPAPIGLVPPLTKEQKEAGRQSMAKSINKLAGIGDWAGEEILMHYLLGEGTLLDISSDRWTSYMTAENEYTKDFREKLASKLRKIAKKMCKGMKSTRSIDLRFSAEFKNGESKIGYNFLHGTNQRVGGFWMYGTAKLENSEGGMSCCAVSFDLSFQWNDVIDPNFRYGSDIGKYLVTQFLMDGQAESYIIRINWREKSQFRLVDGEIKSTGWPLKPK